MHSQKFTALSAHAPKNKKFFTPHRLVHHRESARGKFQNEMRESNEELKQKLRPKSTVDALKKIDSPKTNESINFNGDLLDSIYHLGEKVFPQNSFLARIAGMEFRLAAREFYTKSMAETGTKDFKTFINTFVHHSLTKKTKITLQNGIIRIPTTNGGLIEIPAKSSIRALAEKGRLHTLNKSKNQQDKARNKIDKTNYQTYLPFGAKRNPNHSHRFIATSTPGKYKLNLGRRGSRLDRTLKIHQMLQAPIGTVVTISGRRCIWAPCPEVPEGTFVVLRRNGKLPSYRYRRRKTIRTGSFIRFIRASLGHQRQVKERTKQRQTAPENHRGQEKIGNKPVKLWELTAKIFKDSTYKIYESYGVTKNDFQTVSPKYRAARDHYRRVFCRGNNLGRYNGYKTLKNRTVYAVVPTEGQILRFKANLSRTIRKVRQKTENDARQTEFVTRLLGMTDKPELIKESIRVTLTQSFKMPDRLRKQATWPSKFRRAWKYIEGKTAVAQVLRRPPFNMKNELALRKTLYHVLRNTGYKPSIRRILKIFKVKGGPDKLTQQLQKHILGLKKAKPGTPTYTKHLAAITQMENYINQARQLGKALQNMRMNTRNIFGPHIYRKIAPDQKLTYGDRHRDTFSRAQVLPKLPASTKLYSLTDLKLAKINTNNYRIGVSPTLLQLAPALKKAAKIKPNVRFGAKELIYVLMRYYGPDYLVQKGAMKRVKNSNKLVLTQKAGHSLTEALMRQLGRLKSTRELYSTAWEKITKNGLPTNERLKQGFRVIFDRGKIGARSQEVRIPFLVTNILAERSITADMYDTAEGTRTLGLQFKGKLKHMMRQALSTVTWASAGDTIRKKCSYYDAQGRLHIRKQKLRAMLNDYIELAISRLPLHNKLLHEQIVKIAPKYLEGAKLSRFIKPGFVPKNARDRKIFSIIVNESRRRLLRKYRYDKNLNTFGTDTGTGRMQNQLMMTGYAYKEAINRVRNRLPYSRSPKVEYLQRKLIKQGYPVMALRQIEAIMTHPASRLEGDKKGITGATINLGYGFEIDVKAAKFDKNTGQLQTNIVLSRNGAKIAILGPIRFTKKDYGLNHKKLKNANFTYDIVTNTVHIKRGKNDTLPITKITNNYERAAIELALEKGYKTADILKLREKARTIQNKFQGHIFNLLINRNESTARITQVMDAVSSMNRVRFTVNKDGKVEIVGTAGNRINLGKTGFYIAPKISAGRSASGAPILKGQLGGGWSTSAQSGRNRVTFSLFFNNTEIGAAFEWHHDIKDSVWNTNTTLAASADLRSLSVTVGASFGMEVSQQKLRHREYTKQLKQLGWEKIVNAKTPAARVAEMLKKPQLSSLVTRMRAYGVPDGRISDFFNRQILPSLADSAIYRYWTAGKCPVAFDGWGVGASYSVSPINPWDLAGTKSHRWTLGVYFRIRWATGRTIVQRFAPPRTQMAKHLTDAELKRTLGRKFGSGFKLEGGIWRTNAAIVGHEKHREGAQVLTNRKSKQMDLRSMRSMNEYFTRKQLPLRVEYSKRNPGLLRLRMIDKKNTNIRVYLDPEMQRSGLVLRNGQVYLAANRNNRMYFIARTISYPFQKDGALHHRALVITDNPLRAADIIQNSDSWIYSRSGHGFRVVNKYRNRPQRNVMTYRKFRLRQPENHGDRLARLTSLERRIKSANNALRKMETDKSGKPLSKAAYAQLQKTRRYRNLVAYIATLQKSELPKTINEVHAGGAADHIFTSNHKIFATLRRKYIDGRMNILKSGTAAQRLKIAQSIMSDAEYGKALNITDASIFAKALHKRANAFDGYHPISDAQRRAQWERTKRAFGVLSGKEAKTRPQVKTMLSRFSKDFFNSPRFKNLRKRFLRKYVEAATMKYGEKHDTAKDQKALKVLRKIVEAAGIKPAPNALELNYLRIRMNAESFTNIHPSHSWIKYLLHKAENNEIDSMPKSYQKYYNRFVKPNYDALYSINPKMKNWSVNKTVSAIADRIRLGTQRKQFESNIRAIRNRLQKTFSALMGRFKNVDTGGFSAQQLAKHVWENMRETDLTKPKIMRRINLQRGVYQVGSYRIRRVGNRVIAGTAEMGDPSVDNVYQYLNYRKMDPNDKGPDGAIARLIIERYSPTPQKNMDALRTMRLPMAKKIATLRGFRDAFGPKDFDQIRALNQYIRKHGKAPHMDGSMTAALNRFKAFLIRIRQIQTRGGKYVYLGKNFRLKLTTFEAGFGTYHRCGNSSEIFGEGFAIQQRQHIGGAKLSRRFQIGSQQNTQTNTLWIGFGGGGSSTDQVTGHTGTGSQTHNGTPGKPVVNPGGSRGKGGTRKRK